MAEHTSLTSLFSDIADAIRTKAGTTSQIVADDFPAAIANIPSGGGTDVSDTTAIASDVASGKIFHTADGARTVGTLDVPKVAIGSIYVNKDVSTSINIGFKPKKIVIYRDLSVLSTTGRWQGALYDEDHSTSTYIALVGGTTASSDVERNFGAYQGYGIGIDSVNLTGVNVSLHSLAAAGKFYYFAIG